MSEEQKNNNNHKPEETRYSDAELKEFRELIMKKLDNAREELNYLQKSLKDPYLKGSEDSYNVNRVIEEGATANEREQMSQLADRQRKFIKNLEDAIRRIEIKTYGICQKTGKLISKERLRAVPHTTLSIEAKLNEK